MSRSGGMLMRTPPRKPMWGQPSLTGDTRAFLSTMSKTVAQDFTDVTEGGFFSYLLALRLRLFL